MEQPDRGFFYHTVKYSALPVFKVYFRLAVRGKRNVPATGPCIVAANHCSYLDPAVLGAACPRMLRFLMTSRLYHARSQHWFYRGMQAVPVHQDGRGALHSLKKVLRLLERGHAVGIFPEGTRSATGQFQEGKQGIGFLAERSRVPVVPTGILGAHRAMPRGAAFPRPSPVTVAFGEPYRFDFAAVGDRRRAMEAFTADLMERIRGLVESQAPPAALPAPPVSSRP